jgi:hypothetical protein
VTLEKEKIDSEKVYEIAKKYEDTPLHVAAANNLDLVRELLTMEFTRRDIKNLLLFLERLKENKPSLKIENDIERLKMLMKTRTFVKLTKEGEEIASKLITEYKV